MSLKAQTLEGGFMVGVGTRSGGEEGTQVAALSRPWNLMGEGGREESMMVFGACLAHGLTLTGQLSANHKEGHLQ